MKHRLFYGAAALLLLPFTVAADCDNLCPPWGNNPDCEFHDDSEGGTDGDLPSFPAGTNPCAFMLDLGYEDYESRPWATAGPLSTPTLDIVYDYVAAAWAFSGVLDGPEYLRDPAAVYLPELSGTKTAPAAYVWTAVGGAGRDGWSVSWVRSWTQVATGGNPNCHHTITGVQCSARNSRSLTPVARLDGFEVTIVAAELPTGETEVSDEDHRLVHADDPGTWHRLAGWTSEAGTHVDAKAPGEPSSQPVSYGTRAWMPFGGVCLARSPGGADSTGS